MRSERDTYFVDIGGAKRNRSDRSHGDRYRGDWVRHFAVLNWDIGLRVRCWSQVASDVHDSVQTKWKGEVVRVCDADGMHAENEVFASLPLNGMQ